MFVVCCTLTHQKSSILFVPGRSKVMRYKAPCFGALLLLLLLLLLSTVMCACTVVMISLAVVFSRDFESQ